MVEIGIGVEVEPGATGSFQNLLLRPAARIGLRDRLELHAGLDILVSASTRDREAYRSTGRLWTHPLDDLRLSVAAQFPLIRDMTNFRVGLDVPIMFDTQGGDPSPSLPLADPQSSLELDIVLGMPLRFVLSERLAVVAFDRVFIVPLLSGRSPVFAAPLGVVTTPTDALSIILRNELLIPEFPEYVTTSFSAALEFSTGGRLDVGVRLTFAPRTYLSDETPSSADLETQTHLLYQLYIQTRI